MAIETKPINYTSVTPDNYRVLDVLKSKGSFIKNKQRAANIKFISWKNVGERHRFGYVMACIFSFGIVAAIKKHKIKKWKRRQAYYDSKIDMNNELRAMAGDYLDRRRQGRTSRKEDKWFKKILKKYGDEVLELSAPEVDVDSIKAGVAVNALDLMKKSETDEWLGNNETIESGNGVTYDADHKIYVGRKKSEHQNGQMVNAKSKKAMYEYDHMYVDTQNPNPDGTYNDYVDVNFSAPINVTVGGTPDQYNCVRLKLDLDGKINLSDPANRGILDIPGIMKEVIKKYPETVLTLPGDAFKYVNGSVTKDGSGKFTIGSTASSETKEIIRAFLEGLDAKRGNNLVPGSDGTIKTAEAYRADMRKQFKTFFESEVIDTRRDWSGATVTF